MCIGRPLLIALGFGFEPCSGNKYGFFTPDAKWLLGALSAPVGSPLNCGQGRVDTKKLKRAALDKWIGYKSSGGQALAA